jgi:hypothetical protein
MILGPHDITPEHEKLVQDTKDALKGYQEDGFMKG